MPDAKPREAKDDPTERAARLGARVAVIIFTVFSSLFVLSSTAQLATAALGNPGSDASPANPILNPLGACSVGIMRLDDALELGLQAATPQQTVAAAEHVFDVKTQSAWRHADETKDACTHEPAGTDAFAKLERLHWAAEASMRGQATALAGARADVAALLGR